MGVDLRPVAGNPEATLRKGRALQRAASSPGQPSSADHQIAGEAYRMERDALKQMDESDSKAAEARNSPGVSLPILA